VNYPAIFYTNPENVTTTDILCLSSAQHTIDMAAYALTSSPIVAALIGRALAGVKVRLYLDREQLRLEAHCHGGIASKPLGKLLTVPGVEVRVKHSDVLMHLKSYCVDDILVRDGSANFSPEGLYNQDNSAIWRGDTEVVAAWQDKFDAMWRRGDNLTVEQAVQTGA